MAPSSRPTQDFVPVKEVRDGIMLMKDGSLRIVLIASSINLALKSADEQSSVILQFQNFLNSLDFSVQIFAQSRRYDIKPYIASLEDRAKEQLNDLLKIQTREYIGFIKTLSERTNIMSKNFFVIIPYTPATLSDAAGKLGALSAVFGGKKKRREAEITADFEANRSQIEQRAFVAQQGLIRCGVRTTILGTAEVVELLYKLFNPGEQDRSSPALDALS